MKDDDAVALTQQIKQASDIVEVVGGYIPLKPVGPTFKGLCPFHDDHRPSFDVDPRRQRYRCWACSKSGDVFTFVQEYEHVGFLEARELLARRAGISLEKAAHNPTGPSRAAMLDVMRWAQEQFQSYLLDSTQPQAQAARVYLEERGLEDETIRQFGLGFAPATGEWLVAKAANQGFATEIVETVGLIAKRNEGRGYYDRFRDRVMFPIRDLRGQVVGFGGRILPSSPLAANAPKYYNSAETPIFKKSQLLYGIDQAYKEAQKLGQLAVVEGYMDVLMAHQHGVMHVVAPMGTALTAQHVRKLHGFAGKVVLVFDADAGGSTGVDRALELFVSQKLDLRVGVLPAGLDPCDLLVRDGAEAFCKVLDDAGEVFEFKLRQVWPDSAAGTLEEKRAAVEKMLTVLAAAPGPADVKIELMVNRIAHRLGLKEETVWSRLHELRQRRSEQDRSREARERPGEAAEAPAPRAAKAAVHEVEFVEVLLADPNLVCRAMRELPASEVEHPGLRRLIEALYALQEKGSTPDLDHLRQRVDNEALLEYALAMQERGLAHRDRTAAYEKVLRRFREREQQRLQVELKGKVQSAASHEQAIELLKRLNPQPEAKSSGNGQAG